MARRRYQSATTDMHTGEYRMESASFSERLDHSTKLLLLILNDSAQNTLKVSVQHPCNSMVAPQTSFHYVGQAGLKLLTSGDPLASASQSAGITGVSHRTRPVNFLYENFQTFTKVEKTRQGFTMLARLLLDS
ncbi:hypothetical protein AAY473_009331 [Plecturocebus cupreus]